MKKRNNKWYLVIPLMVAVVILLLAMEGKAGIVRNATSSQNGQDSLSVPLYVLDTLGNRVEIDTTADWGYIVTRYSNGTKAVSDSFMIRATNTPKIIKNAAEYGGFTQFSYRKQISDLDGTPTNGTYSYEVTVRDSSLKLWTVVRVGEFQLYQSKTFADANDSVTIDGSHLNGLTNAIGATTIADNAIDAGAIATDAIGAAELAADAIGSSELATDAIGAAEIAAGAIAASEIATDAIGAAELAADAATEAGLATWNTSFGTAFTAGSMGDSLNGMQYSKVSQLIVANIDAAISSRGTSVLTTSDNIGINWADVSNPTSTVGLTNTTVGVVTDLADNAIDSATFTSSAKTGLAFYVWNSATRTLTSAGSGGITEGEMWDMLDTAFVNAFRIVMGDTFATFSDSATVDRSSLVIVAGNFGAGAIDAAAIAADAIGASEIADNAIDAGAIATDAIGAAEIAADAIGSSELATTAVNEIVDQTWDEIIGGSHEAGGSSGQLLIDGSAGSVAMYGNGVKLLAGGTEADTSFTNLQAAVAGISAGSGLDSATTSRIVKRTVWGIGGGSSGSDSTTVAQRVATAGTAIASLYPFIERITTVDAAGATATRQMEIDTASVGGSNEGGLVNKAITIKSGGAGEYMASGIIERVNCVAGTCTLQVADALPFSVTAGDSVWIWGAEPAYVIATVDEMAAANTDSILDRDLTGEPQDSTVKGFVKSGGTGGADTTAYKAMLANNGYAAQKDSGLVMAETGTADGALRRGEILTARAVAETTSVILTEDGFGGAGASCTGDGAIAFNLYFVDSLGTDEAVGDGHIALYTNANCTGTPAYWGKTSSLGYIPFSIDTGTYWACASKMASVNATSAQYFHVTASSSDTVLGYGFATSTRAVIQGIVQVSGGPDSVCAYCDVVFEMVTAGGNVRDTVLNTIVLPTPLQGFTNSSGTPLHASGQPFELHKTQNLVSTVGTQKYPVKWVMKVRLADGTMWQSAQFAITNATDVVDVGDL